MFWKQRIINHAGRLLTCLLFTVILAAGLVCPARSDAVQPVNASGNPNLRPAVDPIGPGAKYTAVLYNNRNGLPTSEANAIAQTDDGFIWIGSYAGLIRYDGKTFERIDEDTPISNVRALFTDSHNRLWIGTNDAGFLMMENGRFRRWSKAELSDSVVIRCFSEDADGYIYVGTTSGIVVISPDLELTADHSGGMEGAVQNLRRGSDGLVYALTRTGNLACYDKGQQVSMMAAEDCPVENISCILPDADNPGWFWLGATGSRVYYGQASEGFQHARALDLGELADPECLEEIGGQIWVCARNGIGRLDGDSVTLLQDVPMDNSVQHVMTDYQGNLWFVSTRQGVMKVVPNQFEDLFARWGISSRVVNSTCLYEDMLFLATDEGLTAVKDGKAVDSIPLSGAETASGKALEATDLLTYLDNTRIRSVIRDSRGNLWISPWNGDGLIRYAAGEMVVFTPEDGMASEKCRAVYECEDGSILAAQSGGLSVIRDGKAAAVYGTEQGLTNLGILTVTEGFNGEYILGTDGGGVFIVQPEGITHIGSEDGLGSDVVMRVRRSRGENVIWIVTGNSLAYMTPDHQVTTVRGFPYANNYDLYENSRGELWVLSSSGIYVASAGQLLANDTIEAMYYNAENGLDCITTANSYSELTEDGDLYIACTSGVTKVNIEQPFETDVAVKMAVPFVDANGKRIWPDSDGEFTIPSDTRKLTVSSFVLNYAPLNPKVSCFLKGFDTDPVTLNCSDLTPADYTNLRGGEYRYVMRLEGEDKNGSNELSVVIRKELAIHEQLWFWIVVGTVLLLINIWLIRLLLKRQARRIERKKDQERIAGDLRLAADIQGSALPRALPAAEGKKFDLYASMTPAREVGGDFYDYFLVDDDHLAMVIADVSGKGIPASLFMMVSKALIKTQLMTGLTPAEALTNVNLQLCENNDSSMFVTVWAAVIELSTGKGLACNAGHENPALRRADGAFELLEYPHNMFVGAMKKARYQNREFELQPGDSIFVYTDGVPEAANKAEEMFTEERLRETLNQRPDAEPEALVRHVHDAVDRFAAGAEQFDDITMLCVKYDGPQKQTAVKEYPRSQENTRRPDTHPDEGTAGLHRWAQRRETAGIPRAPRRGFRLFRTVPRFPLPAPH